MTMVQTKTSASAGGEHTLVYDAKTKSLFSAGACGLGWCRNHPLTDALFRLQTVNLGVEEKKLSCRLFHASYYHNLAVDATEGRLYTWGCGTFVDDGKDGSQNLDGVIPSLGPRSTYSDKGELPWPVALVPDDPTNQTDPIADVSAGAYHSVVLTSLGRVYTFGAGQLGQLGREVDSSSPSDSSGLPVDPIPTPVQGLPKTEKVAGIGTGFYNTFAVVGSSRTLYCSGENQNQQCGAGPRNLREMALVTEVGDSVDRVEGGYCHTLVKNIAGQVFSLGCGEEGQRGDGRLIDEDDSNETRHIVTPVLLPNEIKAVDVAAGANHSVVLGSDGAAYTFGANDVGQCGVASKEEDEEEGVPVASPRAVELPDGAGVVTGISAGYAHTVLTTSTNQIYVFGQNDNGQLGLGPDDDGAPSLRPVQVPMPRP